MSGSQKADLAISSGTCTHIWHSPGLQGSHLTFLSHDGLVNTSRWNQNNRVVVTAGASGQLALNYVTGTVMGLLPPQLDNSLPVVNSVCFSKGSKFLATGCANGEIKVWNLKRQNVKSLVKDHTKSVTSIHCSPDDKQFASGSLSGEIWLHRVHDDGPAVRLPPDGPHGKLCVQFASVDTVLVSSSQDGSLNTWDVATCQAKDSYRMLHKAAASSVCFLTASHVLASAGLDEQLMLLDRRSNSVAASVGVKRPLHSMACRDDGTTIAVGAADGTVLLYDPRRLTSPWDQTTCSGSHVINDLHWQHTSSSKSSKTAAKASSQDSYTARSSAEQNTTSAVSMQAHEAPVFATPAPASHAAANNAAMAVFSPLDTNVIPGFQYNSAATPLSSFPQGGAKAALASWSKKSAEQTDSTPTATLAGAGRQPDMQEAFSRSQTTSTVMPTSAGTPTLTFPTPSLRSQQRTPTLAGPAVLQPESPMPSAIHAAAANGPSASSTDVHLPGAFPTSPMPLTAPSANASLLKALPSSPVHGVWNRASQAPSTSQERPAAVVSSSHADRGIGTHLADVAAELLPETLQLPGRPAGQQPGHIEQMQEHAFDHRSLLSPAEQPYAALLAAVQQEMGERLMNLREDMQASQQHITQQFAQHQGELLQVVEAVANKQDSIVSRLDHLTDQLQQLLTKQSSTMLL